MLHTQLVFEKANEWALAMKFDNETATALKLAALFHDVGYRTNYDDHEPEGIRIFKGFANENGIELSTIDSVSDLIEYTRKDHNDLNNPLAKVMHDIDRVSMGMPNFVNEGLQLRKEWQYFKGLNADDKEWFSFQVDYLNRTEFKTEHGRLNYNNQRLKNIEVLISLANQ